MTENGIAGYLGRTGTIEAGKFTIEVKVVDAKQAYGNTLVLVCPTAANGVSGETWVKVDNVKLN